MRVSVCCVPFWAEWAAKQWPVLPGPPINVLATTTTTIHPLYLEQPPPKIIGRVQVDIWVVKERNVVLAPVRHGSHRLGVIVIL